jgi:copper chaperone CopZ
VFSDSSMLPLSVLSARAFIWRAVPISLMRRSASDLTAAVIMTSADSAKREHLLFDAGFPQKIMITLAGLTFVGALFSPHLNLLLQRFLARLECWSLLGLLSSSCCVLQLVLNVFSVGCAGFNTVLGPARPYFVALTMYLQSVVWRQASLKPVDRLVATALCAVLTTLPEQLWVWQRRDRWLSWRRNCGVIAAEGKQLHLRVSGMGCTACTAKVYTTLSAVDGVDACDVALESGTATLRLQADVLAPAEVEQKAIDAVIAAGFRAERI